MTQSNDKLYGKTAVITGAASGIGRALAQELAKNKCQLALADQDLVGLEKLKQDLALPSEQCLIYQLDVSDEQAVMDFAQAVADHYQAADLLFNNAGISLVDHGATQSSRDLSRVMDVNFWGVVYGCTAFIPLMEKSNSAHIINVSSLFGLISVPSQTAYNASKFAVRGYSESLSMDLMDTPIRVSCVHPGGVKTNIVRNTKVNTDSMMTSHQDVIDRFEKLATTTAKQAAQQILKGVNHNKRRILVGRDAKIVDMVARLFPASYEHILNFRKRFGPDTTREI